jgi:uncharacterized membrane protein
VRAFALSMVSTTRGSSAYLRVVLTHKWLLLLISTYVVVMSFVVLLRFYTFRTNAFDLGIFNQAFSTALKGKLFYETPDQYIIPSGSFLGTHFSLLMFLLLPIYALFPFPQTLLITQTVVVALAAVPIYLIAQRILGKGKLPLVIAGAYLLNPATLNMNLFDFHLEAFLPFFLGMFFYGYLVKKWKTYATFLILSLVTIDFAPIMVGAICLAHFFRSVSVRSSVRWGIRIGGTRKQRIILLSTIVLSLLVFYLTLSLSGIFSGKSTNVQQILSGFVQSPSSPTDNLLKLQFWYLALVSVMFLPFLAPSQLVMIGPWFLVTILGSVSTDYSFGYQYAGAYVVPYLIIASIYGVAKLREVKIAKLLLTGGIMLCVITSPFNPLMMGHISGIAYEQGFSFPTSHDTVLNQALNLIPPNASVLTQNSLFTQVSNREDAYVLLLNNQVPVKYVLADATSPTYGQIIWRDKAMKGYLPSYLANSSYGILVNDDGVILLEKGYSGPILLSGPTNYVYNFRTLSILDGALKNDPTSVSGTILYRAPGIQTGTTFWFGPNASIPSGEYQVSFFLKDEPTTNGSLTLQVSFFNSTHARVLTQRTLTQADFLNPGSWTSISLNFTCTAQQSLQGTLEFRGINVIGGPFSLDYIAVTYIGPSAR